jgi:hypothetical protein
MDKTSVKYYRPVILIKIKYIIPIENIKAIGRMNLNFLTFNKFLNGDNITKIKPVTLLIKKRG